MTKDASCIFCRIADGTAEASIVHRDELVTAFMDLHPVVAGHTLVIPNYHTASLDGLDEASGGRMMRVAARIAGVMIEAGVRSEGTNLLLANGAVAGQTVFHAHLHIIPRYRGDGFGVRIDPLNRGMPTRDDLNRQASGLAAAMARS
jgi:histidine triad (HIT) family protein